MPVGFDSNSKPEFAFEEAEQILQNNKNNTPPNNITTITTPTT